VLRRSPAPKRGGPGSIPGQVTCDLWWTIRHWGRFPPSTSVSPHSTDCSTLSIIYHPGLVQQTKYWRMYQVDSVSSHPKKLKSSGKNKLRIFIGCDMNCTEPDASNNSSLEGEHFTELSPSNDRWCRQTDTHRHSRPKILLLLRVFVAASRCLAMKGRIHFTEPLPSNDKWDTGT
jgi:hypothetical protein